MMWTLSSAAALVSSLQPKAWTAGWNLCVGGGVLNNGHSGNDLDIVAIPTSKASRNIDLWQLFFDAYYDLEEVSELPCAKVYKFRQGSRFIDLLVMRCGQVEEAEPSQRQVLQA